MQKAECALPAADVSCALTAPMWCSGRGPKLLRCCSWAKARARARTSRACPLLGRSAQLLDKYLLPSIWTGAKTATCQHRQVPPAQNRDPLPTESRPVCLAPGTVQAAAAKDCGLPGPHRPARDDPHRFLRDQGARHLCAKDVWFMGTFHPRCPAPAGAEQKPAAFADFLWLCGRRSTRCWAHILAQAHPLRHYCRNATSRRESLYQKR